MESEIAFGRGGRGQNDIALEVQAPIVNVERNAERQMLIDLVGNRRSHVDYRKLRLVHQGSQRPFVAPVLVDAVDRIHSQAKSPAIQAKVAFRIQVGQDGWQVHSLVVAIVALEMKDRLQVKGADAHLRTVELGEARRIVEAVS